MRKFLLSAFLLGLAAAIFASDVPGTVNAKALNLRMQSTLKSPVVGRVKQNEQLIITGRKGSWLEIKAPESVKIYVSRAYISNGKALIDLNLRTAMSATAASFGTLPKGSPVKILQEHKYGWVRIAPPADLRVYAAALYVSFDAAKVKQISAVKPQPAPAAKPAVKPEKKAEAKPAVKAEKKAEAKPAVKAEKKAEAKPAAKPVDKPVEKPAEKAQAISPADPRIKALKEFGIDALKTKAPRVTLKGTLYKIPKSINIATSYALGNDNGDNIGFICAQEEGMLQPFTDKPVVVSGKKFQVKGWKSPIIWLDEIDKTK